jgi:hypothetical protein
VVVVVFVHLVVDILWVLTLCSKDLFHFPSMKMSVLKVSLTMVLLLRSVSRIVSHYSKDIEKSTFVKIKF